MRAVVFAVALGVGLGIGVSGAAPREAWAQESQIGPLRAAAKSNAADAAAALALGRALRRAGHLAEALGELRRGMAVAGSSSDLATQIQWEVARVHMDRHDFGQTLTTCVALGKLRGASAEGHACAADAHLVWQRATEALSETAAALAIDPSCYEARVAEGRAQEFALDLGKSEAAFRAALALRPDGVDAHLGLARVLLKEGKNDSALAELRRAVELDPHGPDALFELAQRLAPSFDRAAAGAADAPSSPESRSLLERATRERPSFADAWVALGALDLSAGRIADARSAAEAAVRNDPKNVGPHVLLGKVALADNRADDAIKEGGAALKILGNSASAKLLIADADAKKGDIDLALEAYQAAWGLDRGDPTPLVHASQACHAAGRDTSARAFAVKATQEFPQWAAGWDALGDALLGQGEKAAARDAYGKALSAGGPLDREAVKKKIATLR